MNRQHTASWLPVILVTSSLLALSCGADGSQTPAPTFPVDIRLGGQLPTDGLVGPYTVHFTEAYAVFGELTIFGMNREAAGYATLVPDLHKHAGHPQGNAEMQTQVPGTYAVNLAGEPPVLATNELTEGHYFDGSVRLRPASDTYAPIWAESGAPLSSHDDLWGHTLLLRGEASRDASEVYDFEIVVDAEALVSGLIYAGTVKEGGATRITTRLELGVLLDGLSFASLADADGHVSIQPETAGDAYDTLKARLQDPASYVHEELEPLPGE